MGNSASPSRSATKRKRENNGYNNFFSASKKTRRSDNATPRNNVSSLRIQVPPIRNDNQAKIARLLHEIKKQKKMYKNTIHLDKIFTILKQMNDAKQYLLSALEVRLTTPGRLNPEDVKLIKDLNDEYQTFMNMLYAYARKRS